MARTKVWLLLPLNTFIVSDVVAVCQQTARKSTGGEYKV